MTSSQTPAADVTFPHFSGTPVRTLPEAFQLTAHARPDGVALRTPGSIVSITWREYSERVERIAAGLAGLGVKPGDTIGIMLTNRPEFHLVDTAALHLGAIPFSIYNTSAPEQIEYLFGNADNRVVVTENVFLDRILQAHTAVEHVIVVDGRAADAITLADLEGAPAADFDFDASWRAVQPTDVATLIYTSGTTGPPKGVEITHRNLIAQLVGVEHVMSVGLDDRVTSYLPAAHIADRVSAHANNIVRGVQITSVADPREIAAALPDTRPTVFFGVPRVWQKIKAGIEAKLASEPSPVKRNLANWAIGVGLAVAKKQLAGERPGVALAAQHRVADTLVLSKLRHALGLDQVKFAGSGAAAIPKEVLEYFLGLGITVLEVWGMSETTGVSTTTTHEHLTIGTVGRAVDGVEIKVAEDGELLVRGPVVMRGYRKQPDKTAETIDADGWLRTGDIATVDAQGDVKIVDRKKELIISEAGKNMSPTNIENAMKAASSLISQAVAIGDGRPFITALIALDPDAAAVRAKTLGIPDADIRTLAARDELRKEVADAVRSGNDKLSRVEQVKRFVIADHYWEPGGEELTPTMKLRRKPIGAMYADRITDLYADAPATDVVDLRSS